MKVANMIMKLFATILLVDVASSVATSQVKRSWGDWDNNWDSRCTLPPCPEHANYEVTGVMESWHGEKWPTEVVFTCWPGYTLVGSRTIECYDGRWSDHTPQCIDYRTRGAHAGEFGFTGSEQLYNKVPSSVFQPQHPQQQFVSHPQQFLPHQEYYVPHRQQPVPQPQQLVPQPQQPVPQPQQLVPQPQQPVPQPQQPVPQPQQLVPQPQQPVPQPQQSLPQPQQSLPQPQQSLPQPQQFLPQPQQSLPQPQQFLPQPQQFLPQPQQSLPQPQQFLPQPQQPVSLPRPFIPQQQSGINNCCRCDIPSQQLLPQLQQPMTQPQTLRARGEQPKKTSPETGGCILPPYPVNGTYKLTTVMNPVFSNQRLTANLTYSCRSGYDREGVPFITCLGGRWSDNFPTCKVSQTNPNAGSDFNTDDNPESRPFGGILNGTVSIAVAGGIAAQRSELPWHVGIYDKGSTPFTQICGGSIVSENRVISAAHCFWDDLEKLRPASQFAVGAGKLYRDWDDSRDMINVQKVDVSDIKVPPRYQHVTASFQEDIAVLTTATSFMFDNFVMPVILNFDTDLDSRQLQEGNLGKVGGWGLITEDGQQATILQVVQLPSVGIERCIAENDPSFQKYITGDKICAGYKNGTAVCMGDSGGGLVYTENENATQRHYLRGIVSTAPSNDNACNIYDWTTFTHLLRHDRFVQPLINA